MTVGSDVIRLRRAVLDDVPAVVALLAADPVSRARESLDADDLQVYRDAFHAVDADPAQLLVVATDGRDVVATMQLTFLRGLARRGALRAQIEGVRVHPDRRGRGLGTAVFGWAIAEAGRRGCAVVQLTSDKARTDAHRFYDRLGFVASHVGYKLQLEALGQEHQRGGRR